MSTDLSEKIIFALDVPTVEEAQAVLDELGDLLLRCKVGLQLLHAIGFQAVKICQQAGKQVFLDAKLHDIPNTVAGAVKVIARQGVWGFTLHAIGGSAMMKASVEATRQSVQMQNEKCKVQNAESEIRNPKSEIPKVVAVTVLTSLDETAVRNELLVSVPVRDFAVHLARLARFCGCDGVVCSGQEVERIKEACGEDFLCIVPGVRPSGSEPGDQRRTVTVTEAIKRGADYLVIGRPVLAAEDRQAALSRILDEVAQAL